MRHADYVGRAVLALGDGTEIPVQAAVRCGPLSWTGHLIGPEIESATIAALSEGATLRLPDGGQATAQVVSVSIPAGGVSVIETMSSTTPPTRRYEDSEGGW